MNEHPLMNERQQQEDEQQQQQPGWRCAPRRSSGDVMDVRLSDSPVKLHQVQPVQPVQVQPAQPDWSILDRQLYGREDEERALKEACARLISQPNLDPIVHDINTDIDTNHKHTPELCLITGVSGSGKTALAHSLAQLNVKRRGRR